MHKLPDTPDQRPRTNCPQNRRPPRAPPVRPLLTPLRPPLPPRHLALAEPARDRAPRQQGDQAPTARWMIRIRVPRMELGLDAHMRQPTARMVLCKLRLAPFVHVLHGEEHAALHAARLLGRLLRRLPPLRCAGQLVQVGEHQGRRLGPLKVCRRVRGLHPLAYPASRALAGAGHAVRRLLECRVESGLADDFAGPAGLPGQDDGDEAERPEEVGINLVQERVCFGAAGCLEADLRRDLRRDGDGNGDGLGDALRSDAGDVDGGIHGDGLVARFSCLIKSVNVGWSMPTVLEDRCVCVDEAAGSLAGSPLGNDDRHRQPACFGRRLSCIW